MFVYEVKEEQIALEQEMLSGSTEVFFADDHRTTVESHIFVDQEQAARFFRQRVIHWKRRLEAKQTGAGSFEIGGYLTVNITINQKPVCTTAEEGWLYGDWAPTVPLE